MTEQEIQAVHDNIDKLTQYEMASLWRFAPTGHKYFDRTLPFSEHFERRFKELGGFTAAISKALSPCSG